MPDHAGKIFLVATPIGNLEDITQRALRVLRECDVVAAEDTRRTGRLLKHFEIEKPLLSCHQHNEARRADELIARVLAGENVALVSDAGTPGISDPGERFVRRAIAADLSVEPVPGACALVGALSASGLPTGEFHFVGFLPNKSGQRRKRLEALADVPGTWAFYESPYRIEKLLNELADLYPESEVVLARELTKLHEEFIRGKAQELPDQLAGRKLKGELVVLVNASARSGEIH